MAYVLPNRKAFADAIARKFLEYRKESVDASATGTTLIHQKLVKDYLSIETPYRGSIIFHGLGSGKTRTAVAAAEAMVTKQKIFVMLPKSLQTNFVSEVAKFGESVFEEHAWQKVVLTAENRETARSIGIPDKYLEEESKFYTTDPAVKESNFGTLSEEDKAGVKKQVLMTLEARFSNYIAYNGLSKKNIDKYAPTEGANPYDNSVIIIDEVHNFITRAMNNPDGSNMRLYEAVYRARNAKIIALSGTPIINRINEIAYLMNLVRGPMERIILPLKVVPSWDEELMRSIIRKIPEVDTIEFDASKKYILVTRNPPNFRSLYSKNEDTKERIAVKYDAELKYTADALEWVKSIQGKVETALPGYELAVDRVFTQEFQCLPTKYEDFVNLFVEGLNLKNTMLFQRRIQGLVSYFKGAAEGMLPVKEPATEAEALEPCIMSREQLVHYLGARAEEMKMSRNAAKAGLDADLGKFRVGSRLACNYALPSELAPPNTAPTEDTSEDTVVDNRSVIDKLKADPEEYLKMPNLAKYSTKMARILERVTGTLESGMDTLNGTKEVWKNQFVYSQYLTLEGLGVFGAILEANGWQKYAIEKVNGQWREKEMDPEKPAYAMYSGEVGDEERNIMLQIYNHRFQPNFPASLTQQMEARGGKKLLCMMMASAAGAEGITLACVRHVHIMEPHWTPARHEQVIGRAIRIHSHRELAPEERTVRISFYLATIADEYQTTAENLQNIVMVRRADTVVRRYASKEKEEQKPVFMSTDEYLYQVTYEKNTLASKITLLLKQAAVDCEIHRKLHASETPAIMCMRFDTSSRSEDLAFRPNVDSDERDDILLKNQVVRRRKLKKVNIKGFHYLMDDAFVNPVTKDKEVLLYDFQAYTDGGGRLLLIGVLEMEQHRIRHVLP